MKALILPLFVVILLPYLFTSISKFGAFKMKDNPRTRDWQASLEGWRKRAHWAQLNSFETLPIYVAAILTAMIVKPESAAIVPLAWAIIGFRLAYGFCYVANLASLRSTVWFGAQLSAAAIFGISFLAAS